MTFTKAEILVMPAGREMDALVAEELFGWKLQSATIDLIGLRLNSRYRRVQDGDTWWITPSGDCYWPDELPAFSTDLAAVLQITKIFDNKEWIIEITKDRGKEWSVTFEPIGPFAVGEASDTSLSIAIYRAALFAVLTHQMNDEERNKWKAEEGTPSSIG